VEADLIEAINASTRRLVRKQRTWFRSQLPSHRALHLRRGEPPPAVDRLFADSG
jgi:tRNA A37 N6-isopentenylltransferase MiaA